MQKSEFEKQVQAKMDELKIHPSEAVWPKIEVQIKKEKQRRGILIFIPLLLVSIMYGGYLLINNEQAFKTISVKNNNAEKIKVPDETVQHKAMREDKKQLTQVKTITQKKGQDQSVADKFKSSMHDQFISNSLKDTLALTKKMDPIKNLPQYKNLKPPEIEDRKSEIFSDKPYESVDTANQYEDLSREIFKDSNEIKPKDNIAANRIKSGKHLWSWGISFTAGRSAVTNGLLGAGQKSYTADLNSGAQGSVSGVYSAPSVIKSSAAFIAGFFVERNISNKMKFSAGLNYKSFNTTNTVGTDSSRYLRANNDLNVYHNAYHYIEVPAGLKIQIGNSRKMPLYWNAGFSLAHLISSNALQFNYSNSLYHTDNSQFNKTQFGFNTGLDIGFISKEKNMFVIGPYINYGFSKIGTGTLYSKAHFIFAGVKAQIIFRKK